MPTPASVVDRIRDLCAQGLHAEDIAQRFNDERLVTAKGQRRWTPSMINKLCHAHAIAKKSRPRNQVLPERHPVTNRFSIPGAAKHFHVSYHTVKNWVRAGIVTAHRERFGRYDAVWLDIDDALVAKLERLPRQR